MLTITYEFIHLDAEDVPNYVECLMQNRCGIAVWKNGYFERNIFIYSSQNIAF